MMPSESARGRGPAKRWQVIAKRRANVREMERVESIRNVKLHQTWIFYLDDQMLKSLLVILAIRCIHAQRAA